MLALLLGWFSHKLRQAERQEQVVAELQKLGATVTYHNERAAFDPNTGNVAVSSPWPPWLLDLLGVDFFGRVVSVEINAGVPWTGTYPCRCRAWRP